MEALNAVLTVCVIGLLVAAMAALYFWMEAFSYEAYVPRYIEVPVFIEKVRFIHDPVGTTTAQPPLQEAAASR